MLKHNWSLTIPEFIVIPLSSKIKIPLIETFGKKKEFINT